MSLVLVREEGSTQLPIYYISNALLSVESRNTDMQKLVLSLIIASRRLRPYFQAHSIWVVINFPFKQVLQKPDALGRRMKWTVELSEFDISCKPKISKKG
ncbi:unnamed protein product [Fraxinus pennsylvanica]|uniref:Reverse transcriptase RNase H-like domain-containing protein n=1 Tax=Fraxinus pennsylvanica TaxID=56036 RepID=A0AAD2A630_9LAMI|nr:unnamed protein product [Fraxinus pennsylvanica]